MAKQKMYKVDGELYFSYQNAMASMGPKSGGFLEIVEVDLDKEPVKPIVDSKELSQDKIINNNRAKKLLSKGKRFIVVAVDEPYFIQVYRTIRNHERKRGKWSEECERNFRDGMEEWLIYD